MSQKQSVAMTQEELMNSKINGVIITLGADIRHYGHVLNLTGDEEVFGCDLVDDVRCPRGSYIIPLESVIKLRDFLNSTINLYYGEMGLPIKRELTPKEKAIELITDMIERIYK